jgi:lipid II:glycine glycyltransferase (peptidoglycan interpeptide bridge formation enzyme)
MLNLEGGEDRIQRALRDSTRRNIRKAEREGVQVSFQNTLDAVAAFYRLHCLTRKRHGLPPQPWRFFQKVYEHIIATGKGTVVAAAHGGRIVAGAVYFFFQNRALFKFGASDRSSQHLRTNNLVMWEAIRFFVRNGIQSLHFGRTEQSGKGLLQFKRGWGAEENMIVYYRLALNEHASPIRNGHLLFASVFRILPMPLLKLAGSMLYRHVG